MKTSITKGVLQKITASPMTIVSRVQAVFGIETDITTSKGVYFPEGKYGGAHYNPSYIKPRMIAMHFVRKYTPLTYQEVANLFMLKKHSTVIHACKWTYNMLFVNDLEYAGKIRQIEEICSKYYIKPKKQTRRDYGTKIISGSSVKNPDSKQGANAGRNKVQPHHREGHLRSAGGRVKGV